MQWTYLSIYYMKIFRVPLDVLNRDLMIGLGHFDWIIHSFSSIEVDVVRKTRHAENEKILRNIFVGSLMKTSGFEVIPSGTEVKT